MTAFELRVTGMTCEHCARTIEGALNSVPGVRKAEVSYPRGLARVEAETPTFEALVAAVRAAGYGAERLRPDVVETQSRLQDPPVTKTLDAERGRSRSEGRATPERSLDIAIIGGGSAAFAAAIRASEEGAKVTMIEYGTLGGTCVNVGCVPSKIMIRGAHIAHETWTHSFDGVGRQAPAVDRRRMLAQQQARVDELRQAKYQSIVDGNSAITLLRGRGRFKTSNIIVVDREDERQQEIRADRLLIATGAAPAAPPIPGLKDTPFWTSTEALVAEEVPGHLIVLGGSAVGVELGQAFRRLGARVTVLELQDRLLPTEDEDIGQGLRQALEAEGIEVHPGFKTESANHRNGHFEIRGNGKMLTGEQLLVATGRRPNTAELGLEAIGVKTLKGGAIEINHRLETSVPGIYAAGDCTSHPQFVYVAAAGGTRAAINMTGGDASIDLSAMPAVVFTDPQVATVGLNERTARDKGFDIEVRRLTLDDVPRALANFDTRGFIKLVAEKHSGRLLGAQILAAEAGEIIQIAVLAIRHGMTVQGLGDEMFPYLVMAEGLKLCAQIFTKDVKQLSCCAG